MKTLLLLLLLAVSAKAQFVNSTTIYSQPTKVPPVVFPPGASLEVKKRIIQEHFAAIQAEKMAADTAAHQKEAHEEYEAGRERAKSANLVPLKGMVVRTVEDKGGVILDQTFGYVAIKGVPLKEGTMFEGSGTKLKVVQVPMYGVVENMVMYEVSP